MINEETKRKLIELSLKEAVTVLELQQQDINCVTLSFDERFQLIVDHIYQDNYNKKVQRLMKTAQFRFPTAEMNTVLYTGRNLDKNKILELSSCQFIDTNLNIIIQGFTGSGKTFLACAFGKQACKKKIRTRYIRLPDLLVEYDESRITAKTASRLIKKYSNYGVLILDEWLLEDISEEEQHFLFELMERRHDFGSTIFCTQYRTEEWHARLGGAIHADAIMDRIIHNATWIKTGKMNMREYCAKNNL